MLISNVLWLRKLAQKSPSPNSLGHMLSHQPCHCVHSTSIRVHNHPHPQPSAFKFHWWVFYSSLSFLFCFLYRHLSHPQRGCPSASIRVRTHMQHSAQPQVSHASTDKCNTSAFTIRWVFLSFLFTLIHVCRQRISKQTRPHATQHAMHPHSQCLHPPSPSHPTGFFFLFLPLICVTLTRNASAHHVHASAYHVHHPISPILVSSFFVVSFVCTNLHPPPSPQ